MKRTGLIWLLAVTLGCLTSNAPSGHSQASVRNLAQYKQGPSLNLDHEFFGSGSQRVPGRQFLWELWSSRTKGLVSVTFHTIEGDPSTCRYFVEPDSRGQWRIVSECKYEGRCPYTSKKRCGELFKTVSAASYDTVERIDSDRIMSDSPSLERRQVPTNEDRDPLYYILIFRDSSSGRKAEF
jgi:hypothetical protein